MHKPHLRLGKKRFQCVSIIYYYYHYYYHHLPSVVIMKQKSELQPTGNIPFKKNIIFNRTADPHSLILIRIQIQQSS